MIRLGPVAVVFRSLLIVLVVALASLCGCTPTMHRAYQTTMASVAMAGWVSASVMTHDALSRPGGDFTETNPLLGRRPSMGMLVAADAINLSIVTGISIIPDDWIEGRAPWIKDVLLTLAAFSGACDAYGDYRLITPRR